MNTEHFKTLLMAEKVRLEAELGSVGTKNPEVPGDWIPTSEDKEEFTAVDPNERADAFEDQENRAAVEGDLENRLGEVVAALAQITAGTYGTCEVCSAPIEEDRLNANAAARTCKAHMNG